MNDPRPINVSWHPNNESSYVQQLEVMYRWKYDGVPILNVKLSPTARIAAVQKVLPQERSKNSSIGFFETERWSLLWRQKVPFPHGGTGPHKVNTLFLSDDRHVLADTEITMYERDQVLWKAEIPIPTWPVEAHRYFSNPEEWKIGECGEPAANERFLFVPVHWIRRLEPGGGADGMSFDDAYTTEVVSIDDGRWDRRIVLSTIPTFGLPPRREMRITNDRAELWHREQLIGTLEASQGRRITAADVSMNRALVVLDAHELLELKASESLV
jgi:hypothetical protein